MTFGNKKVLDLSKRGTWEVGLTIHLTQREFYNIQSLTVHISGAIEKESVCVWCIVVGV